MVPVSQNPPPPVLRGLEIRGFYGDTPDLGYVTRGNAKRRRQEIKVVARPSGAQMVD